MLLLEGAHALESDLTNLDRLYARGTRCIQLTYNARNLLGDGCTERTNAGLSDFGVEVLHRMNELGIVVDLSHCGEQTTRDALTLGNRPPAFTHTMCKAIYDHVRAKSDELNRANEELQRRGTPSRCGSRRRHRRTPAAQPGYVRPAHSRWHPCLQLEE
jgi:membrane dipeptidase